MSDIKSDPNSVPHKGAADVVYPNPQPPPPPVTSPAAGQVTMPRTPANELPPPGFGAVPTDDGLNHPGTYEHAVQPGVNAPVPMPASERARTGTNAPVTAPDSRSKSGTIPPQK